MSEAGLSFPGLYDNPRLYTSGLSGDWGRADSESILAISRARSNPETMIRIYRAVPLGITDINPGDWVSPSKTYATLHGMHPTDPTRDMPVINSLVLAKEIR